MRAIRTRYHGATNVKGSRISACDSEGFRVILSYDHALNGDENHKRAAYALRDKMKWRGEMVGGSFGHDMYWVFQ